MNHYLDLILIPVQIIIVIYTIYYIILAAFGMWRRKEKKNYTPKNTFAVIICAHNEEAVVGQLIKNLHDLDYPDDMYDIFVVADNCTDSTAQVAEAAGAHVYVRENKVEVGKGYAMGWMFDRVEAMDRKYDAYIIFDADNLVHPQFLREMNHHLEKGESVIQGYLNAKNPTDSWVAGTFSIMFWTVNHMWHLAKYNVGLSTALGGTGMCIRTDIIRKYGWDCNSLTEDMEFSMKLLSHGVRTCWAHDAIIYDEKVTGFMASCRQRLRWAQGQFDTAGRYIPILFAVGIKKGSIRILDGIIQVSQPYFLLLTTIYMIISTINSELINYWGPEHELYTNILFQVIPVGAWQIIWFLQYAFPLVVLLQIKVPPKCWFYYLIYPIFVYSWIPVNILGFIRRHDKRWSHTAHTRAVAMGDVKLTRMGDMHHK
jgi:glycosyltransferase, family 2